jgi:hypothetical protein
MFRRARRSLAAAAGALLLLGSAPARGGELRDIELSDGTHLRGEIVSAANGSFHVRSESLGEVDIPEERVRSIASVDKSAAPHVDAAGGAAQTSPSAAAESMQHSLAANPKAMERVLALQDDPNVRAILADPALMQAIQSNDLETLGRDPRIRALLESPTVQELGHGATVP